MTMAINEIKQTHNGVSKHTFDKSLQHMSEQVRQIDNKLTKRVENVISGYYQDQRNETQYLQMMIERMKQTL